jgi:hypothetical protein
MTTPLVTTLNLGANRDITVLGAPDSFTSELAALDGVTVRTSLRGRPPIASALAFATTQAQVDDVIARLAPRLEGDAVLWFAYPKGSSKRHACDFNRDTGWARVGEAGFEPVRSAAIDEDWTALRFRRVEFIRSPTRDASRALSPAGQARTRPRA